MDLDNIAANYQRSLALKDVEPLRGAATKKTVRVLEQLFAGLKAQPILRHRRPSIYVRSAVVLRFHNDSAECIVDDPRGSLREFRLVRPTVTATNFGSPAELVFVGLTDQTLTLSRSIGTSKHIKNTYF